MRLIKSDGVISIIISSLYRTDTTVFCIFFWCTVKLQSSFWDILTQKSVESPDSMKHKYSHPSAHRTSSVVVNLTQNMSPHLLQSSHFHRPRIVWQSLLAFYCSNWAEMELFGPGCKITWSPACAQLCLSKNMRLLRWPFPTSRIESSNWVLLFLSAELKKNLHLALIGLNITRNIKNTVKGEILYCKLLLIHVMSCR